MSVWEGFISVMQAENKLLEELIVLSAAKQQKMNDAQEVARLANEEQSILPRLEQVDRERALLFDALAAGQSLEEWLSGLDGALQDATAPLIMSVVKNLETLQSLNNLNRELLNQSLNYVQFSLNLLQGDDGSPTYTRPGSSLASKSIFDRKV